MAKPRAVLMLVVRYVAKSHLYLRIVGEIGQPRALATLAKQRLVLLTTDLVYHLVQRLEHV